MLGTIVLFGTVAFDFKRQMQGKESFLVSPGKIVSNCMTKGVYTIELDKRGQPHKTERFAANKIGRIPSYFVWFLVDLIIAVGIHIAFKHPSLSGNYILKSICVDAIKSLLLMISVPGLIGLSVIASLNYVKPELIDEIKSSIKSRSPIK